jgi:hypothetical protein
MMSLEHARELVEQAHKDIARGRDTLAILHLTKVVDILLQRWEGQDDARHQS